MTDLRARFTAAAEAAKALPKQPSNDDLLKLYAFYKQASAGDVTGNRPGMMDFVGRAKYDAWSTLQGMSTEDAMTEYIDLVGRLETDA